MAKQPKKRRTIAAPQPLGAYPLRSVSHRQMDADSRMGAALRSEAAFLRSIGFPEKAALIEAAVPAIGLASSERILAELR